MKSLYPMKSYEILWNPMKSYEIHALFFISFPYIMKSQYIFPSKSISFVHSAWLETSVITAGVWSCWAAGKLLAPQAWIMDQLLGNWERGMVSESLLGWSLFIAPRLSGKYGCFMLFQVCSFVFSNILGMVSWIHGYCLGDGDHQAVVSLVNT